MAASMATKSPKGADSSNSFASRSVGSRSHSPHFSPDRITRHASPSRQDLAQREVCIVPRIPQPYRTSFSAVTSPMRVPKAAASELTMPPKPSPINLLGAHKRTTSPGRITPMKPTPYRCPTDIMIKQCMYGNAPCSLGVADAETVLPLQGVDYPDIVQDCNTPPEHDIKSIEHCASLPQDRPAPYTPCEMHDFITDTECSSIVLLSDINVTAELGMTFDVNTELGNIEMCDSLKLNREEIGHVKPQSGHRKLFGKFRSYKSVGGTPVGRDQDVPNSHYQKINDEKKKEAENGHPSESRRGRARSKTLPSQVILDDASANLEKNQKSLSLSITSFFKKMSPKSLRRFAFNSEKAVQKNHDAGTSSDSFVKFGESDCGSVPQSTGGSSVPVDVSADGCGISVDSDVPLLDTGPNARHSGSIKKSPRMSPIKRLFRLRDSDTTNGERRDVSKHITEKCDAEMISVDETDVGAERGKHCGSSGQQMTQEMSLILKSIEDHLTMAQQKSVYQAFKDKRSPVRTPEGALGFRPQVLQAVEFPENLLEPESLGLVTSNPGSGLSSSLPGLLDDVGETIPVITCHGVASDGKVSCAERLHVESSARKREPPRTLDVRPVQRVTSRGFQFPSVSVESIGQCSLDVAHAGSEASLVQNGHFSSTSASKRTLNSQENITEPTTRPALHCDNSCESLDKGDNVINDASNFDDVESRTPSYLKLSRAIGGYTPYNTYVSIAEHERIRTENNSCRSNDSSGSKEPIGTEVVLQNGDAVVTLRQSFQAGGYGSTERHSDHVAREPSTANGCASRGSNRLSSTGGASAFVAGVPDQRSGSVVCADSDVSCDVPCVRLLPQVTADCWGASDGDALRNRASLHGAFADSVDPDSTQKDGWFFLNLVDDVELCLKQKCIKTEQDLLVNTSEEVEGKLRATVGKANLLIKKKFQQFRQLCHASLEQNEDEPFKTTVQDLSGFWDMVLIQVNEVDKQFEEIDVLRQSGWKETKASENHDVATPTNLKTPGTRMKTPKSSTSVNSKSPSPSSSKSPSSAAAKAREEARRRLMAAKMAGRQRKASESDKDIEIFVS